MTEPTVQETQTEIARVTCPACGSVHSADGGTLLERSPRLLDLEAAKPRLERLQKIAVRLEKQLLDAKKKPAAAPAAPEPAPKPATEKRESGERKKHGRWL